MGNENEQVVRDFIRTWERHDTLRQGYETFIAEDCLWENTGLRPIRGRDAVLALLERSIETWGEYSVHGEPAHVAIAGDIVFVERRDVMKDASDTPFCEVPIAGVFEVSDRKIVRWSDYYDPKPMLRAMDAAIKARQAAHG
jgi:limonene-1,2-epoxide hydrolase